MPLLRYLVTIAIGIVSLLHDSNIRAEETKTFMVAAHEWAPFTSRDSRYFGIAPRLVSEILQNQGIEVKYRFIPWAGALDGVITSEFDGAIVWVTEDLQRDSFLVSDPILEYPTALYYLKSSAEPKSLDDLLGHRLGVNTHYIYDLASYRLLGKRAIEPVEGKTESELLHMLLEGKIDYYASPLLTEKPLQRQSLGKDEQNALTYSINLFKFPSPHLVVSRHREGSAEFMNKFNQHLKRLKNERTIERYVNDFRFIDY
jgi:polar amino acid transport system substrate-binding protein